MKKSLKYVLYILVGMAIYQLSGAKEQPEILDEFHSYAPLIILSIFGLLMVMKYVKSKKEKNDS